MRLLFTLDKKDYDACQIFYERNSSRAIIICQGKIAMVHSQKYDYYKFPGGGIEQDEDPKEALIRETREESGLQIIPESIEEYGYVHRIQKSQLDETRCWIQENYYYLCQAQEKLASQSLDGYEAEEGFRLEFVDPQFAIDRNEQVKDSPYDLDMFRRENGVLQKLMEEGYFHET